MCGRVTTSILILINNFRFHSRVKRFHLTEYEQGTRVPQTAFIVRGTH